MYFLIDIFLILFICIFTYFNYKKGLIEVAYKVFSFFIAIIISIVLFHPVSSFLTKCTSIDERINTYTNTIVENQMSKTESNSNNLNTPNIFTNYLNKTIEESTETIKDNVSKSVAGSITNTIMNVISFITVFILTKLILLFIHFTSDVFSKLPIIKQFNHLGGFIYGLVVSFLIVFFVLAIISILPLEKLQLSISKTVATLFLYNINPILMLLF